MRIAFITPEFVTEEYYSGGLANYLHRISMVLAGLGHEIHIIVQSTNHDESFKFGASWIHRLRIQPRRSWARVLFRRFLYDAGQWTVFAYRAWRKLEALNKITPIDIVQLANYRACGLCVVAFSNIPHVTRLSSLHQVWHEATGIRRHFGILAIEWLEWMQLRYCRHVYAPSQVLASMLSAKTPSKTVTILRSPAFIETSLLDEQLYRDRLAGRRYLLFVGRYELHKGIDILARALPQILATLPDCEAVLVGRDSASALGPSMKEYVRQNCAGFSSRLHFFDQIPHQQLYPIIAGARLMVLPSLADNLPNTMLEAMSFGCPVVGTIGASFDELIEDNISGFLVPRHDPDALANKVIAAWNHPNRESIGQAGQRVVEQLKPEVAVARLVDYYREVLNSERSQRHPHPPTEEQSDG